MAHCICFTEGFSPRSKSLTIDRPFEQAKPKFSDSSDFKPCVARVKLSAAAMQVDLSPNLHTYFASHIDKTYIEISRGEKPKRPKQARTAFSLGAVVLGYDQRRRFSLKYVGRGEQQFRRGPPSASSYVSPAPRCLKPKCLINLLGTALSASLAGGGIAWAAMAGASES